MSQPSKLRRALLGGLATLLLVPFAVPAAKAAPLKVVTSFSILADLVHQVGGDRVHIVNLVGPAADAHDFQPRPSDSREIANADLVLANGLGFDSWLPRLAQSAGYTGRLLTASAGVAPLTSAAEAEHGHEHEHGDNARLDPHAWQDVSATRHYVANIAAALAQADPAGAAIYEVRAKAYDERLQRLDAEIRAAIARLPADQRKVVSSHDAFGYFSRAYGLQFIAPVGLSTHAEASAGDLARLIRQLRKEQAPLFLETIVDQRLITRIEKESGCRIGGTLYSDALSAENGPAASYEAMMRYNLKTLIAAFGR